jgi:3-dehydrosphinganine reductase
MSAKQNIVITGGSSGLGFALAEALAKQGHNLCIIARNQQKLADAQAHLQTLNPDNNIIFRSLDLSQDTGLESAFHDIATELGGISILINSAGILREGYFEKLSNRDFRSVMDINYFGVINATRAALPHLKKSKGRLINIASMAALTGVFGYAPYCGSKYALLGLSEVLRYELTPQGITVQIICPGEFESPMVAALNQTRTPENREHTLTIPITPIDVIVNSVLTGMKSRKFMIIPGFQTRFMAFCIRYFNLISRWIGAARIKKVYIGPRA